MMRKTVFRISDNPLLGYVYKKNYRDNDAPNLRTSYPYTNSHGFRDVERSYDKPEGTRRIIVLGDSVVAGHMAIESHDQTISRELEKLLVLDEIEVLNMGIAGYCTHGEVELLKEVGLRYSPDLVVLVFVANDYIDLNTDLGFVTPSAPLRFLVLRSHLVRYLGIRYNLFGLRTQFGIREIAGKWAGWLYVDDPARRENILNGNDAASETIRNHLLAMEDGRLSHVTNVEVALPALKRLSEEHGFEVVIGVWPSFGENGIVDTEGVGAVVPLPVDDDTPLAIEIMAQALDIPVFRFSTSFRRDHSRRKAQSGGRIAGPGELYSQDDMHPNPLGARVAAQAIAEVLDKWPELIE